jgi:fluoride exporter
VLIAVAVGLLGGLGAVTRYLADGLVQDRSSGTLPFGTLAVNITGSFVLGLVTGALWYHGLSIRWRSVVGIGFCGGLTTWSTASWETVQLATLVGRRSQAAAYALGSLGAAVLAAAAGIALVGAL